MKIIKVDGDYSQVVLRLAYLYSIEEPDDMIKQYIHEITKIISDNKIQTAKDLSQGAFTVEDIDGLGLLQQMFQNEAPHLLTICKGINTSFNQLLKENKELRIKLEQSEKEHQQDIDEKAQDDESIRNRVIDYLNKKTGRHYRYNARRNGAIFARLNEGYTEQDFYDVIDNKFVDAQTKQGFDMRYMRPDTLFGAKFDIYLNGAINTNPLGAQSQYSKNADIQKELINRASQQNRETEKKPKTSFQRG